MFRLAYIIIAISSFGSLAWASDIILERLTSLKSYQEVIEELKTTEYSPALNGQERESLDSLSEWLNRNINKAQTLDDEQRKLFTSEFNNFLAAYPVDGFWIIKGQQSGKILGRVYLEYNHSEGTSEIYTHLIDRAKSGGVGTKARQQVYEEVLPFVGQTVDSVTLATRFVKRSRSYEIERNQQIFAGIVSNIYPYNNFGSLISQIRSGAQVCVYQNITEMEEINLCYPEI